MGTNCRAAPQLDSRGRLHPIAPKPGAPGTPAAVPTRFLVDPLRDGPLFDAGRL